jgi:hypothetical protein
MKSLFFLQIPLGDTTTLATPPVTPTVEELKFIDLVFDMNSLWIMIPLYIMFFLAFYIFIERLLTLNNY